MKKRLINRTTTSKQPPITVPSQKVRKPASWWLKAGVFAAIMGFAGVANAADVYLQAQSFTKTITVPDPTIPGTTKDVSVPMWGFASCDATFSSCAIDANLSGPQINVDLATDTTLNIHLKNILTTPVSIVIPGQVGGGSGYPETMTSGRVQSFTHEAAANGGTADYSWTSLNPGTYLYQSGTQPSIQVPMGLYGALVVNVANADATTTPPSPGVVYPGNSFDTDAVLLFSEIDPVQNQRVADAAAGGPATQTCEKLADWTPGSTADYPCTIDYNPIYFLVNGQPTADNLPPIGDGTATQIVLLRFLNAGLRTHTPAFVDLELGVIAEDGNPYPDLGHFAADGRPWYGRQQSTALLPAGKTLDALVVTPATNVTLALFDHMPTFNNKAAINGDSALASLQVGSGTPPPGDPTVYAADDSYAVTEDTPLNAASVLSNDTGLTGATVTAVSQPANGTLAMNADGTFVYTPNANFSGADGFTYKACLTPDCFGGESYPAQVTLNVSFVNDAPVANEDTYTNIGSTITMDPASGVLGNDSDADGDSLTATLVTPPTSGTLTLNEDGSFTYTGAGAEFDYVAVDGSGTPSAPAHVTLTLTPGVNVALTVQEFGTGANIDSYRWIVQEDATYHLDSVNPEATPVLDQQSLNLHKSSMPVIAQGCVNCTTETQLSDIALDPNKYYYVSVLPNDAVSFDPNNGDRLAGHTIGGAQIKPGDIAVTAILNKQEIPTAQIAIEVFQDTAPTNGAIDGGEPGLGGFTITLEDAGGRYGISGGTMLQDTFGNPLKNALGDPDPLTGAPGCFGAAKPPVGVIETCPDTPENRAAGLVGHVLVKDLAPGKYGVIALPPASAKTWVQTSTIEGTKIIDTWVKAAEPPYFNEFGLVGPHAFIGFTRPETTCMKADPDPQNPDPNNTCQVKSAPGTHTITGKVTALHDPKPPLPMLSVNTDNLNFFSATRFWVGLNSDAGIGPSIATIETDEDGNFSIPNVPDGNYQVVVWDIYLDAIISYFSVNVAGADVDMVTVNGSTQGMPAWFTRSEHNVFLDDACGGKPGDTGYGDGIRQPCEVGLPEQAVNIRWRDGTVNQSFPTDSTGFVPFDEAFPFFSWQLYEIDYLRYKPTGVTVTVDAGGPTQPGEFINPQIQNPALFSKALYGEGADEICTDSSCTSRTEKGSAVLLEAFQSLPGQTLLFDWGKVPYEPGQNGGIAGIVFYSSTRAEGDPRLTVGEPWEPGIANVKVRLYHVVQRQKRDAFGAIVYETDPVTGAQVLDPITGAPIPVLEESLSLVKEIETDSWDASIPTGCQGETDLTDPYIAQTLGTSNEERSRCIDGFRGWNQVRPGVFDGGYAFNDIPPGKYVVEAVPPTGYEQYKEEDVNVSMGDARTGDTTGVAPVSVTLPNGSLIMILPDQAMILASGKEWGLAQPPCVGQMHRVPAELSLFPGEPAPFADSDRPLCNRKLVVLSDQGQSAADFHFFTTTPVAAQFTGLITDDISMETNPASPMMGEKFAPAYMPFSIRDHNGTVVYRGLGDAFGRYNGLLPSTFSANIPDPSGYSPAMMQACLNDAGATVNPRYFSACNTGQFMPGTNTYLDTPILPQAAFAGGYNPPDCAAPQGTPVIAEVNAIGGRGAGFGPLVSTGGTLQIVSQGTAVSVPNPDYQGPLAPAPYNQLNITRDFGFGTVGGGPNAARPQVYLEAANGTRTPLTVQNGSNANVLRVTAPATEMTGQLVVVRADNGNSTTNAITVTVSNSETPIRVPADQPTIQAAIDAATPNQLVLVDAGTYNERVIMWKPVRLQGVGTDTVIDALQTGATDLDNWRAKLAEVLNNGSVNLLPELATTIDTEGAGITVLGTSNCASQVASCYSSSNPSRIDGFTVTNGANGGGILVHAYADGLEISNNTVTANSGQFSGGIRIGQPNLPAVQDGGTGDFNKNVNIHNNVVALNGALNVESAGGGISMNFGSTGYTVANNFICGNYTAGDGAGIGHLGVSDGGRILSNKILFNQAYNVGQATNGGGILVAGESAGGALSSGTGGVTIDSNLIKGNHAGSGHGGGIRLQYVNGSEIAAGDAAWQVLITNNTVVNNVAAWSGAGISLLDAVSTTITNNIVANNDTTATEGSLVVGNNSSTAQPSGIVAQLHSANLIGALSGTAYNLVYSDPDFGDPNNNTIWHNRAFHLGPNGPITDPNTKIVLLPELNPGTVGACDTTTNPDLLYWDLGVLGSTATLNATPTASVSFVGEYCNGARDIVTTPYGPIQVFLGTGEGGNFVDVRYGPLLNMGNYTIQ